MGLLQLLVLCTLAACYTATSPGLQVLFPSPLLSRDCNDSDVLAVAGFALQEINRNQKDGYVLSLNRVSDAREHHQVYGQCKAIFHINKPRRVLYLPAYNCTLRPVSRRKIHSICPDCPVPVPMDSSDLKVVEAATESLAKYNSESPSKQYSLVKITKASSQWVFGSAYFVEYLVKESPCTRSEASCSLQSSDSAPVGLCKGSLTQRTLEKFVTVNCDFFEPQNQVPGDQNSATNRTPVKQPTVHEAPGENTAPASPGLETSPRGSVRHRPDLDDERPEGSQAQTLPEAFPVQLDLTSNPQGEALDLSFLYRGPDEGKLVVLPFPGRLPSNAKCPGPANDASPLILPP